MKIVAAAGPLADAVMTVTAGVRMTKKKLPALLDAVRLETADDAVLVISSNNRMAIAAVVAAEVIEPGRSAVSDRLGALASGFAAAADVSMSATEHAATIVCGHSRSRLAVLPWQNLPIVLAIDDEIARVEISGHDCLRLLWPFPAAETE